MVVVVLGVLNIKDKLQLMMKTKLLLVGMIMIIVVVQVVLVVMVSVPQRSPPPSSLRSAVSFSDRY